MECTSSPNGAISSGGEGDRHNPRGLSGGMWDSCSFAVLPFLFGGKLKITKV
jgi:hypothetical protein